MEWSIKDRDEWSDELKTIVEIITGGYTPGISIKEEETYEQRN